MGKTGLRRTDTQGLRPIKTTSQELMNSICIYCASSDQIPQKYFEAARELGRLMGERGMTLVNGAGNMGLMRAGADACMEAGGKAIGIIPTFMIEEDWHHKGMTELIETPDMHTRQQKMAELSDAGIVLAGGFGTLAELSELVTWKQLGIHLKPIVLLNTDGYYDELIAFLRKGMEEKFLREEHLATFAVASTPQEALDLAMSTPLWNANVRRFAKL